jgi:hypothetical protein
LQRLDPRPLAEPSSQNGGLKIVYPPDGALIEWRGEEVPLEGMGQSAVPLAGRWKTIATAPPRRPIYWQPDGIGFAQLAVIDADGRSVRSTVRLSP